MCTLDDMHKLTLAALRAMSVECGVASSGRKSQVIDELVQKCTKRPQGPLRLLSIDLGLRNIGVCQVYAHPADSATGAEPTVEPTKTVEKWYLESLPKDLKFRYPEFSHTVCELADRLMVNKPDVVLVEKQRARSSGGPQIPNSILRVNIFEGMLHALLQSKWPSTYVESVDPKSVVTYWRSQQEPEGSESEATKTEAPKASLQSKSKTPSQVYALSKNVRKDVVKRWLSQTAGQTVPFELAPEATPPVKGKRDDLDDALVQAITWFQWRANGSKIVPLLEPSPASFPGPKL